MPSILPFCTILCTLLGIEITEVEFSITVEIHGDWTHQEVSKKNNDRSFTDRRDVDRCFFFDFRAKVLIEMMYKRFGHAKQGAMITYFLAREVNTYGPLSEEACINLK